MTTDAEQELRGVPFPFRRQINQRLFKLKAEPRPEGAQMITEGVYRLRIEGWKVLYTVTEIPPTVTVMAINPDGSS